MVRCEEKPYVINLAGPFGTQLSDRKGDEW